MRKQLHGGHRVNRRGEPTDDGSPRWSITMR